MRCNLQARATSVHYVIKIYLHVRHHGSCCFSVPVVSDITNMYFSTIVTCLLYWRSILG